MSEDQYSLDDPQDQIRLRSAWDQVLRRLAQELPSNVMERFIVPLKPLSLSGNQAVMGAPGAFVHDWVKDKYLHRLQSALSDELGEAVTMEVRTLTRERPRTESPVAQAAVAVATDRAEFRPNERYRFESFVVGQSNRLAYAGAKAVAKAPGQKYNPLFIYGPSGMGKTHLLHAVAHDLLGRDARYAFTYISAQQFAEDFVSALQSNRIDQFRRAMRSVNVWLVDDIQLVAGKDRTQEEVFHTFNALHSAGRQIVLCSDRPPRDLFLMDERLRSRFESGLVADIQPPDTELRCAILLSKAKEQQIELPHEVAMLVAERMPSNVRILEGALTKLAAEASLSNQPITMELAAGIVERHYTSFFHTKPGVNQIVAAVGKHYRIPIEEIKGVSRKAPIAHARHVAVFIAREITGDSWKHLGAQFGDRDHTSMMHAYQKISEMMATDRDLSAVVKMLIKDLHPEV